MSNNRTISLNSPAKINLFLHIVGKRPDGYHNLASLFQTIDLCDKLHIELTDRDQLTCTDPTIPTDHSNLVLKAAELFRRKTGLQFGIRAHLEKNIPHQSGLGGGSSNAATTLWILNQLSGQKYSVEELSRWSSEIGSDIPFFFSEGTAYCTGKGENVQNMPKAAPQSLWIIKPNQGLSTPLVYGNVKIAELPKCSPQNCLDDFSMNKLLYFNDLEKAAFGIMPTLWDLKQQLLDQGFRTVVMTGSGSGFYCMGAATPNVDKTIFCKRVNFLNRDPDNWYTHTN